jgi:hypothetical protein
MTHLAELNVSYDAWLRRSNIVSFGVIVMKIGSYNQFSSCDLLQSP